MLHRPFPIVLSSLLFVAPALAQQTEPAPAVERPKARAEAKSTVDYVKDLGSDSFRQRTQAERALRAMGSDALPELQKAVAADADVDPETQWRARRLIRQIERGDEGLSRRERDEGQEKQEAPRRRSRDDMQRRFDDLFADLETRFGVDIPRARFFEDGFFQDLQQQLEEMRSQGGMQQNQSMSMQVGPDGVRVEVKTKNDKGETETKIYEAPDMETFQQKYPDVLQRNGLGMGLQFGGGLGDRFRAFDFGQGGDAFRRFTVMPHDVDLRWLPGQQDGDDDAPPIDAWNLAPAGAVPEKGKRLGVVVKPEIPAQLREYLGVEGGLMVDQVQEDTLASAMKLQAGDIVLEIAGKKIASTQDVQHAIGGVAAGARVDVKVLRRGRELELHADKQAGEAEAGKPLEKRDAPRDGDIR